MELNHGRIVAPNAKTTIANREALCWAGSIVAQYIVMRCVINISQKANFFIYLERNFIRSTVCRNNSSFSMAEP